MPKGIRKACGNCIKARLACDEGRPCQRCVIHSCECVAVPRKPRVKKQKIDMEPPPPTDKLNIDGIDTNADVVVPNWGQKSEFAQGAFGAFQLDPTVQEETQQFDGYAPNPLLSASPRSPVFLDTPPTFQLSPPMMHMHSPIASQIPSPPQLFTPPPSPSIAWAAQTRQLQATLTQQLVSPQSPASLSSSGHIQIPQPLAQTPQIQQPQVIQPIHPIQPVQTIQQTQPMQLPQQMQKQQFSQQPDLKSQLRQAYDNTQMLSLLLEEKQWPESNYVDVQQMQAMFYDPSLFKKPAPQMSALPQPMNATPLYPAPIAVFDKMKFQLLDANEAMANFLGLANVAEMAAKVSCMDDLIDAEGAQVAKQAYTNFVINPSPCFRLAEIRTPSGTAKTVEFHVDLTEQLLIFTIKNVFDSSSQALPDPAQYPPFPLKTDMSLKAFEFLSPID